MQKNIKKENGITLIALGVTIIVLLIIASIGVYGGKETIKKAQLEEMRTNMLLIQAKSKEYYAFLVPVNAELDLKKAAALVGEKNLEMIPQKDLLKVTGYVHGGCSPIGLKKDYQVSIDENCLNFDYIIFSGGHLGTQVKLKTNDFIDFVKPKIGNIKK